MQTPTHPFIVLVPLLKDSRRLFKNLLDVSAHLVETWDCLLLSPAMHLSATPSCNLLGSALDELACPAGWYCPTPAAAQRCPPGFFCPPSTVTPITCNMSRLVAQVIWAALLMDSSSPRKPPASMLLLCITAGGCCQHLKPSCTPSPFPHLLPTLTRLHLGMCRLPSTGGSWSVLATTAGVASTRPVMACLH